MTFHVFLKKNVTEFQDIISFLFYKRETKQSLKMQLLKLKTIKTRNDKGLQIFFYLLWVKLYSFLNSAISLKSSHFE
jgi:hypothetical protein